MKKFTNTEKINGELTARGLSDKAKSFYNETDPLIVYEVNGCYFVRGIIEEYNLTFEELNDLFEAYQEEAEKWLQ